MKTKNILLIALLVLLNTLVSCKKDHEIPTGKTFNEGYGGDVHTDSVVDYEKLLVGTWGVEKIEYYNLDYAGNPIPSTMTTLDYEPSSTNDGIQMILREDKTGEIRDSSIDSLWVEESTYIFCPDTILVYAFAFHYDKNDSLLYMNMVNSSLSYKLAIKELTNNTFVYENEYGTNYMEKAYLKRLSDEPLPPMESYTVNVSANPSNGGVVTGGGTYQQGQSCTVTAIANDGYSFNNWTENDNVVSSDANYTFTITGSRTLVAHFSANSQNYTISVSANPSNGGTVSGGGNYQEGQSCTVTATANSNYTFTNWTENGSVVSTQANYIFTVNGNRTLMANFTYVPPTYNITVSANPTNGGTVTGGDTYQQGQSCTVHATANNGYTFINWTEDGNYVSTSANYTFTVSSDRNLVANFVLSTQSIQFELNGNVYSDGELIECTNDEFGVGEYVQHMQIRNNTSETKNIIIEKEIIQDLDGVINYFCWDMCFAPDVFVSPNAVPVLANSITEEGTLSFHALFDDNVFGYVMVRYYAYEEQSSGERISIIVRFHK